MLLASLLLGIIGCSGGDKAGTAPAPGATTGPAPSGAASTAGETPKPPAPAVEVSPFIHHTPGDVALVIARPSRALNNPIVTGLIQEFEAADPSVKVADELKKMEDLLGIDPRQVEYVVVSMSAKTLAAVTPKSEPAPHFGPPPVEAPETPESPDGPPKVPGTEPPPADPTSEKTTTPEQIQKPRADEPATAVAEELARPKDSTVAPPTPAILIRLLTPIDGAAWIEARVAKEKARVDNIVDQMYDARPTSVEGVDKDVLAEMNKQKDEFRQSMLKGAQLNRSEHGGLTLYQKGEGNTVWLCVLNPQTVLFGPEAVVKATIDRKGSPEAFPLSAQLQTLLDRDFAVAVDLAPVDAMSKSGQLELPFPVMLFAAPLLKCRFLTLAADINGGNLLQVNLVATNEAGAKQLYATLNPLLMDGITNAKAAKNGPGLPAEASPFLPLGEKILNGTKLTQTGDLLSLVVARPAGLEDLPTLARPAILDAVKKKGEAAARNNLQQIALAMHNFHDSYTHFPANDRGGTEAIGLSWRVHILPYLDESELYREFHMDEPWDSEHNKALIPRMPKVYGTNAEGKTSIHVFVGEGTPFGETPIKMQDITDGTSNTIMYVKAGDDTADIWTKPGGLTFDKANPIAALGKIADRFEVLFMDGSVRSLPKTIDAATLGNLILYNDGNPVEIPE